MRVEHQRLTLEVLRYLLNQRLSSAWGLPPMEQSTVRAMLLAVEGSMIEVGYPDGFDFDPEGATNEGPSVEVFADPMQCLALAVEHVLRDPEAVRAHPKTQGMVKAIVSFLEQSGVPLEGLVSSDDLCPPHDAVFLDTDQHEYECKKCGLRSKVLRADGSIEP